MPAARHRPRERVESTRHEERIQCRLKNQDFVEREDAGQNRESGGDESRPFAKPMPGGGEEQPHRRGAESDLDQLRREQRSSGREDGREEVDVQRRHEERPDGRQHALPRRFAGSRVT